MVEKKLFKQAIALVYPPSANLLPQKYRVITYIGSISDEIHKHIKFKNNNNNNKLSLRTNNSLGKYIRNNKSKTVNKEKSGVYQLNCGSCNKIYMTKFPKLRTLTGSQNSKNFFGEHTFPTRLF